MQDVHATIAMNFNIGNAEVTGEKLHQDRVLMFDIDTPGRRQTC